MINGIATVMAPVHTDPGESTVDATSRPNRIANGILTILDLADGSIRLRSFSQRNFNTATQDETLDGPAA